MAREELEPFITPRKIAEWNREIIRRTKRAKLELTNEVLDIDKVIKYALDDDLREQHKFNDLCAMKAEIFLEWLEKKHVKEAV